MLQEEMEQPILIAQVGPLNGQRWQINRSLLIGRDPTCDIVIPNRQISRYHVRLIPTHEGVLIEDLVSKNGSYLNGKLLAKSLYLQDGDVMQAALVQSFVFLSSDTTMPMELNLTPNLQPHAGALVLDSRSRRVWIRQTEILPPLSAPQFCLLQTLTEQPGKVVSRHELITSVWGDNEAAGVSDQALDALVRRIRDRLVELDPTQNYIITVRGYGFRLENPVA